MSKLEKKMMVTLLISVFMMSIFAVSFPVIAELEEPPTYWVKASIGGEFIDYSPWLSRCTLGLICMSLSAEEIGVETAYKGSGVFVDHDREIVVHLDINEGFLVFDPETAVSLRGTARVKDLNLKDKWTGTFLLALARHEDGSYGSTLYIFGEKNYGWGGSVGGAGEANIWVWE